MRERASQWRMFSAGRALPLGLALLLVGAVDGCSEWQPLALNQPPSSQPAKPAGTFRISPTTEDIAAIWDDPTFQKEFVAGYGVNAEIEPRVSQEEMDILEKILPMMKNNLPGAKKALMEEIGRDSAILYFTLGSINFQQDDLPAALDNFKKAVEKYRSFRRAYRNLGLIHAKEGRYDEAIASFTKMITLGGGDAYSYGLLGFAYGQKGDYQAAEVAYRNALLLQPENTEWRLGLTRCVYRQDKFEDAATLLNVLIERYPDKADFWLLQANAYLGMKQPLKAAQNLEALDRLDKANADSLYLLGNIYVTENLLDLAVISFEKAVDKEVGRVADTQPQSQPGSQPVVPATAEPASQPTSATSSPTSEPASQPTSQPDSKLGRALTSLEILASRGAFPQAGRLASHIRKACGREMTVGDRRRLLKVDARLAMAEGGGDKRTADVLEELIKLDPLDGDALMLLGQYYVRTKRPDEAMLRYERAGNIARFEADAKVRHAQVLVSLRRYRDALPLLRRAQEIKPREEVARYIESVDLAARTEKAAAPARE